MKFLVSIVSICLLSFGCSSSSQLAFKDRVLNDQDLRYLQISAFEQSFGAGHTQSNGRSITHQGDLEFSTERSWGYSFRVNCEETECQVLIGDFFSHLSRKLVEVGANIISQENHELLANEAFFEIKYNHSGMDGVVSAHIQLDLGNQYVIDVRQEERQ